MILGHDSCREDKGPVGGRKRERCGLVLYRTDERYVSASP
jgi:hypothetical protein